MSHLKCALAASLLLGATGCASCAGQGPIDPEAVVHPIDPTAFVAAGLVQPPKQVDCTLGQGTRTRCYELQFTGRPTTHAIGPFCPTRVDTPASEAGIWLHQGEVHDLSGAFVRDLSTFYDDDVWQLYDPETGSVRVTDTKEGCDAAARPDVALAYNNYCVQCDVDEVDGSTQFTVRLPIKPVKRTRPIELDRRSKVGASLEGVVFDPPAPVDHILAAHTIAAFDDCGGHVNPHTGYHYHSARGCSKQVDAPDGHAPLIGYALDGFGLYAQHGDGSPEPSDLDACRGHQDAERGYHYHVAGAGENLFISCFMGELGEVVL